MGTLQLAPAATMGKRSKKKKQENLFEKIEKRRQQYDDVRLKNAITSFFAACDEDGSGELEPYEFAVAQKVLAEIAEDHFDHAAAARLIEDSTSFVNNHKITIKRDEFCEAMMNICQVLPRHADDIVNELTDSASKMVSRMRREMGAEIRRIFKVLDVDGGGTLDRTEIAVLVEVAEDLAVAAISSLGGRSQVKEFLSLERFETSKEKDGQVDMDEFLGHFLEFLQHMKIPKGDVLAKLRAVGGKKIT